MIVHFLPFNSLFTSFSLPSHLLVLFRDVRIPHSNGIGGSSPHSRSHEHLAQPPAYGEGTGVAYGGDMLSDEVLSEVNVGGAQSHSYQKGSGSGYSGDRLIAPPLHPHGHSHSFSGGGGGSGRVPNYRSVTVGNGSSVPVPNQSSPSHSYSGVSGRITSLSTPGLL